MTETSPTAPAPVRVLLAEDLASDAELALRELRRHGLAVEAQVVDTREVFQRALKEFRPEVILSDFTMPGFDGHQALGLARRLAPQIPFIFVSGTMGEEYAVEALKSGAVDYVLKYNLRRLGPAVERAIAEARARQAHARAEAELASTRSKLANIVASLDDVVWSVELPSGRVDFISPAAELVYGRLPDDFLREPSLWLDVVHPLDRDGVAQRWRAFLQGAEYDVEYRIRRPDGGMRWVSDRARLARGPDGAPVGAHGLVRDITDRKQQELRIARLRRVRELSGAINAAIVRIRSRADLFDAVCGVATDVGGFPAAWIGVLEAASREFVPSVWRGLPEGFFQGLRFNAGEGLDGQYRRECVALKKGQPFVRNRLEQEGADYARQALAAGAQGAACFPLMIEDQVQAVLVLHAAEAGAFDGEEVKLLRELSANVSFALNLLSKSEQLDYLAFYDVLTGLPNRNLFQERLAQVLGAARDGERIAVVLVDLDRFKLLNDTLGRHAGDLVLQKVAGRLQSYSGSSRPLARIGADQFAVVRPGITDDSELLRLGESLTQTLETRLKLEGQELLLTAKVGIAVFPSDGSDVDALLRNAESALRKAKRAGDRYLYYRPDMNERAAERLSLEARLRRALGQEQFVLHYQPKISLASGTVVGAEALIRWNDPENGLVPPGKFIWVLEESGLILDVGRWVLLAAARDYVAWRHAGLLAPPIAVNVSALQLRQKDFIASVEHAVTACGAFGVGIGIEITESMVMHDLAQSVEKLAQVRELGPDVSLDDFGTGYSSLNYLAKLPLDLVKIDRSFISNVASGPEGMGIVSAVISIAHGLNLKVVAEGVETAEQAGLLKLIRCDQAQGYHFGRPVPFETFSEMLAGAGR